ncbi:MAG TPA: PrsW family glutamic-type intramembrane protease [Spirochaetia bacterium]
MYTTILWIVSAAPAVVFLLLIMRMDREEPEPLSLVVRVIGLGAVAAIVASFVERMLGVIPLFHARGLGGAAASAFLQVAPVEELAKLAVVLLFVWRNPNFNEENDGIVYVGASAIGFALLENVGYVFQNGIDTGIVRAFTAVPLHVFTAVIMGLNVGRARFAPEGPRRTGLIVLGFLIAWAVHGAYDTLAMEESGVPILILPIVAGVATFGVMALKRGRRLSVRRWRGEGFFEPRAARTARAPRWMAVVGRILIVGSAVFWGFLLLGFFALGTLETLAYALVGGLVLTFFPLSIGIILEVMYRRWRRRDPPAPY